MDPLGLDAATIAIFVGFGLLVGVLFGFFGMGGSFLVTPAFLAWGYPVQVAVGSGLAFVFGTSVVGALKHRDHGHVDYRLAALTILGTTLGIGAGKRLVFSLEEFGSAELAVSVAYVCLLALVGAFTWREARSESDDRDGLGLAARVQEIRLPPTVTLAGDVEVSAWVVVGVGVAIGVLSGFLGVGGGFLLLPAMIYGLGVPAAVAVGTDVLQITATGAYGAFLYAEADAVALPAVGALLAGSALGARIGAAATTLVDGEDVEGYFAATLFAGSLSVAAKEVGAHLGVEALAAVSVALVFGAPVLVAVAIALAAVRGLQREVALDANVA